MNETEFCAWCGKSKQEHVESRDTWAAVPRVPCLLLKAKFLPRAKPMVDGIIPIDPIPKSYDDGYTAGKKDFTVLIIEELKKLATEKAGILAAHGFAMLGMPIVILFAQEEIEIILNEIADR